MKRKILCLAILVAALALLVASCAPQGAPLPTVAVTRQLQEPWAAEWESLVSAAKGEGKVSIYSTAGDEAQTDLANAFKAKYGIDLEFVTGRAAETTQKLLNERRAGLFLGDITIGGSSAPVTQLMPEAALDPLKPSFLLPEVLDT